MWFRKKGRIIVSYIVCGFLTYLILKKLLWDNQEDDIDEDYITSEVIKRRQSLFLIDTPKCKIPDFKPDDPSLKGLVKPGVLLKCKNDKVYTHDNGSEIYIDWNAVNNSPFKGKLSHCTLTPITRPVTNNSTHDSLGYLSPGPKFNDTIDVGPLNHDHFLAKCFDHKEKLLFVNYHTIIIRKKEVEERCKAKIEERAKNKPDVKETLNVFVLVVDSVSRLNTLRYMKKTRDLLLNELGAVEMSGFHKVGERTYENVIPLVTGKTVEEFGWNAKKPTVFDSYRFIWSDFADNGFRTYYAEDFPYGATFDYDKPGFKKSPTDYFNRHLFLSMYKQKQPTKIVYNEENCILHKTQTDWVIDNAHKFATKFKRDPYFCYVQLTRITHDYVERTATADEVYYKYLKRMYSDDVMNNAVLFFMADHGIRFGSILSSYVGLMEDRLPMLYMVLPKWFRDKYPSITRNLKANSRKLTTHFDVYETFQDLSHFTGNDRKSTTNKTRGYSLFSEVPLSRTCVDANIPSQYCSCSILKEDVDVGSKEVKSAAEFFITHINTKLQKAKDVCQNLTTRIITSAKRVMLQSQVLNPLIISHEITLIVKQGGGQFKAIIVYDTKRKFYKLGSEIHKVNRMGSPKKCPVEDELKMFCFCQPKDKKT